MVTFGYQSTIIVVSWRTSYQMDNKALDLAKQI